MHEHSMNDFVLEGIIVQLLLATPFLLAACLYGMAVMWSNRRFRDWQVKRSIYFAGGIILATLSLVGPIAERAHTEFEVHMVGHLLLGMLAPMLIALGRPMTLLLRTLPVKWSRKMVKLLQSFAARFLLHPIVTALLNVGGLWLLYMTPLFELMHAHVWLYFFVHFHVFIAGYLFTVSILQLEPFGVRVVLSLRAAVLLFALALHGILAKLLYVNPPGGVGIAEAERGAMVMYYGGDLVDALLIVLLCVEWYKAEGRLPVAQNRNEGSTSHF